MNDTNWVGSEVLLRRWLKRAREDQHSHYEASKHYRRANTCLAIPVVAITTGLGTAAFATITASLDAKAKLLFGVLSLAAAALSAMQANLRYSEKSEKHRSAGAKYGAIRRRIEAILSLPASERGAPREIVDEIRKQLDEIGEEVETVSRRIFRKTIRRFNEEDDDKALVPVSEESGVGIKI